MRDSGHLGEAPYQLKSPRLSPGGETYSPRTEFSGSSLNLHLSLRGVTCRDFCFTGVDREASEQQSH